MIILINGSFGVGKTTVARLLVNRLPKSMLFDPEIIGFVLRRLPGFIPLKGRTFDDFQDIELWRKLTILTAVSLHKIRYQTVIIPMTFSNLNYLNQIRSAFLHNSIVVRHFCLTASVDIVHDRLMKRGVSPSSVVGQWVYPRATYCCQIHAKSEFREHIATDDTSPNDIVDYILEHLCLSDFKGGHI